MDTSVTQTTKTLPPEDEEEDDEWGKLILLLWESIQLHLCLSQNWLMWSYNLPRVLDSIFKFWNPKFHFIGVFIRKKKSMLCDSQSIVPISASSCSIANLLNRSFDLIWVQTLMGMWFQAWRLNKKLLMIHKLIHLLLKSVFGFLFSILKIDK